VQQKPHFFLLPVVILLALSTILWAKNSATVTSERMAVDKGSNTILLEGKVVAIKKATDLRVETDRMEMTRDPSTDQISKAEANGNVVVTEKERVLKSKWAFFDRFQSRAELKGKVSIQSEDYQLRGEYIRFNTESKKGKITALPMKMVYFDFFRKGETEDAPRRPVNGKAKEIVIDEKARKVLLSGNVEVIDTSDTSTFLTNRATILFDASKDVQEIIANGDFSMVQEGRISRADRAIFDYQREIVDLIGNAYVKDEEQVEIESSRIEMYMDVERGVLQGKENAPVRVEIPLN